MKLPRDVSSDRVIGAMKQLGYSVVRQKGSHIRLMHPGPPAHFVTVPDHNPLRMGTLHSVLAEVAQQRSLSIDDIAQIL